MKVKPFVRRKSAGRHCTPVSSNAGYACPALTGGCAREDFAAHFESLEPRKLLSTVTGDEIAAALDIEEGDYSSFVLDVGNEQAIGIFENYTSEGLLGLPSGPDGDFLVISTACVWDAVRQTDPATKSATTKYRDLGAAGVADDYVTFSFTITVPTAVYNQRLMMDFIYASDEETNGGDFFDIFVNGVNIAESGEGRIEAGGRYVINERDSDLDDDVPDWGFKVDTEYSDLMTIAYDVPDGTTTLDITIQIADSVDAEQDAWALIDNLRFSQTQVVYLDLDGQDIDDFFITGTDYIIDEFDANDFGLGSDYADVLRADLQAIFSDFDIQFVTTEPVSGDYMRVVVGGDNNDNVTVLDTEPNQYLVRAVGEDPDFDELFNYINFRNKNGSAKSYGLADRLDLNNSRRNDMAVVFSGQIARDGYSYTKLTSTIAHYVGRNLGLRAESNAFTNSIMAEDIALRGNLVENADHTLAQTKWGDEPEYGTSQNTYNTLLDLLGSAAGDLTLRKARTDIARLNEAHWTAVPPKDPLFDATFIIIGDKHTRTTTTTTSTWEGEFVLVTDYAGQDPQIIVTSASKSGKEVDFETLGPKNLGQYTSATDDSQAVLISLFEYLGNNSSIFAGSVSLLRTAAADTTVYYSEYKYTEDDGDQVTIKLSTRGGLFAVSDTDAGVVITLAETDGEKDSLKITVSKKEDGDGRAVIGGILGSGIKTLTADKADFDGTGIDLLRLKTGKFGTLLNGTDFNVRQDEDDDGSYTFESVADSSHLTMGRETKKLQVDEGSGAIIVAIQDLVKFDAKGDLTLTYFSTGASKKGKVSAKGNLAGGFIEIWRIEPPPGEDDDWDFESINSIDIKGSMLNTGISTEGRIQTLKVGEDLDADITARVLKKLDVKGDWSGSMLLTEDDTEFKYAADNLSIKGVIRTVLFQAAFDVNKLTAGAVIDSNFYVGFDLSVVSGLPVDGNLVVAPEARLKKVDIKGVSEEPFSFVNSFISAPEFDSIRLGDVKGDNLGVPFGVSAFTIDKIEYDTGTGKVSNKNEESFIDNDSSDDFLIGQII